MKIGGMGRGYRNVNKSDSAADEGSEAQDNTEHEEAGPRDFARGFRRGAIRGDSAGAVAAICDAAWTASFLKCSDCAGTEHEFILPHLPRFPLRATLLARA